MCMEICCKELSQIAQSGPTGCDWSTTNLRHTVLFFFSDLPVTVNVQQPVASHPKWPTTPSNSPIHANDVNITSNDIIIDYLSSFDLPTDLESNHLNNNFDGSSSMDVDQDVADWLDSLMPPSTHPSKPTTKPETILPELNGNFCSSMSDPLLGLHPNNVFMPFDDSEMCSNSIWDQ